MSTSLVLPAAVERLCNTIICNHRAFLDLTSNRRYLRWGYFALLFVLFWQHILFRQSHYVIAYMYAVFLLNLLLRFMTPLDFEDLCAQQEKAFGGTVLPCNEQQAQEASQEPLGQIPKKIAYEFRPFLRQMNEFTFWLSAVRCTHCAILCLFFSIFDLPVFWPLLVLYFILLFATTMKQQVHNMIKYKYIPFNFFKRTYSAISRPRR